jgi:hypothetical protein
VQSGLGSVLLKIMRISIFGAVCQMALAFCSVLLSEKCGESSVNLDHDSSGEESADTDGRKSSNQPPMNRSKHITVAAPQFLKFKISSKSHYFLEKIEKKIQF